MFQASPFCFSLGFLAIAALLALSSGAPHFYITYTCYGGSNNVRESFTMAAMICNVLRKHGCAGVVMPTDTHVHLEYVFDFTEANKVVRFINEADFKRENPEMHAKYETEVKDTQSPCQMSAYPWKLSNLLAKYGDTKCSGLKYAGYWKFTANGFIWENDKEREDAEVVMRLIKFNPDLLKYTMTLREQLPKDYLSVHFRGGDRTPMPLANCTANGWTMAPLASAPCTHPYDPRNSFVTYEEVIFRKNLDYTTVPIFVATHSFKDERFQMFRHYVTVIRKASLFVMSDLINKTMAKIGKESYDKLLAPLANVPVLDSFVDQILCVEGVDFIGHGSSSWTEFVLYLRYFQNKPGWEPDFRWFEWFSNAFPVGGFQETYYDCVGCLPIPNFVTRCPEGTAVSGTHCCCSALNAKCVGPECTTLRHPKTHMHGPAFKSTCLECYCNPPA